MTSEATCRGSYVLGTACGNCSRCKEEEQNLKNNVKRPPVVVTELKILVDDKVWDEIQKELSLFSNIHLKINDYKITLQMAFSSKKMRAYICIYIDGILTGGEKEELKKMFWNEKHIYLYSLKMRKAIIKTYRGKDKALGQFPRLYDTRSYYIPSFNSFSVLKNQYKKRHKEIFWIRK